MMSIVSRVQWPYTETVPVFLCWKELLEKQNGAVHVVCGYHFPSWMDELFLRQSRLSKSSNKSNKD